MGFGNFFVSQNFQTVSFYLISNKYNSVCLSVLLMFLFIFNFMVDE